MATSIITSRTQRMYLRRPGQPYCFNKGSQQAQGLVAFWPFDRGFEKQDGVANAFRSLAGPAATSFQMTLGGSVYRFMGGPDGSSPALNLIGTTTDYIQHGVAAVANYPVTYNAWFSPASLTTTYNLNFVSNNTATSYSGILFDGANSYAKGAANIIADPASAGNEAASATAVDGLRWHMATGVFTSTSLRSAFLNGGNKGTNSTVVAAPSSWNHTNVGCLRSSTTTFSPLNGGVCHVGIWNIALSDDVIFRMYDPPTRWDLLYPLGRATYSFPVAFTQAAPPTGGPPPVGGFAARANMFPGFGGRM